MSNWKRFTGTSDIESILEYNKVELDIQDGVASVKVPIEESDFGYGYDSVFNTLWNAFIAMGLSNDKAFEAARSADFVESIETEAGRWRVYRGSLEA